MGLFKRMEKAIHKFSWYDMSILKVTMVAIGILLVMLFPQLLEIQRWIYAIIAGVGAIYLWSKMLCPKNK